MGFAQRLFSRQSEPVEQAKVASVPEAALVQPGRVFMQRSEADLRAESVQMAALMFGRRLHRAPSGWLDAPCVGLVSSELAAYQPDGFAGVFAVGLAPGWSLGVLAELSPRFLVIEARALVEGRWAGAVHPGGEHLLAELLALIEQAKEQQVLPVLINNASVPDIPYESLSTASAVTRVKKAVPAVIDGSSLREGSPVAASRVLRALFDYWQEGR